MKNQKSEQMAIIMSIVERGSGTKLTNLYTKHQVFTHLRCEGRGTATSEILDILGLGSSEKDIVLSFAPVSATRALLSSLNEELRGSVPGRGIAFSAKLSAVSNLAAAVINARTKLDKEVVEVEQKQKSSLILVIVNQGFTDTVMETAKKAGARGGTIIRSRWVGEETFEQFYGIARQAEKEILAIVAPQELRNGIMEAINAQHGMQSEAGAMVSALGIEQLVHLG